MGGRKERFPIPVAANSSRNLVNPMAKTVIFLLLLNSYVVQGDILIYQQDQLLEEFRDMPAQFGGEIPDSGIKVRAVQANPIDGCSNMTGPPENATNALAGVAAPSTTRFAVIIARYNCSFEDKIRNAQRAGYAAVIVHNVGSNDLERMSASHAEDILIPSVFIGESNGMYILDSFLYPQPYALIITDDVPFNINNNLIIPFAIVVGLCFMIMVVFMIIRCIRERRRMLRHRLPSSVLKKIPIVKFAKGMQYDTCAICLDDYVDNERLRVLPCHHAYHVKCIDPWLTKNRRVCPICKRKVFARGERRPPRRRSSDDSMSSSDADENTPLLNPAEGTNPAASATVAASQPDNAQAAATPTGLPDGGGGGNATTHRSGRSVPHVVNVATSDDEEILDANYRNRVRPPRAPQTRRFNLFSRMIPTQQIPRDHQPINDGPAASSASVIVVPPSDSPYSPIGGDDDAAVTSAAGAATTTQSTWQRFMEKLRSYRRMPQDTQELFSDDGEDDYNEDGEEDDDDDVDPVMTAHTSTSTGGGPIPHRSAAAAAGASNNILNHSNHSGSFHGEDTTDDEMVGASYRDDAKRRQIRSAPNLPSTSGGGSGGGGVGARLGVAALPNVNFNPGTSGVGRDSRRSQTRANNSSRPGYYPV